MEAFPVGEGGFQGEFRELFPENLPQHIDLDLSQFNPGHLSPPFYPYDLSEIVPTRLAPHVHGARAFLFLPIAEWLRFGVVSAVTPFAPQGLPCSHNHPSKARCYIFLQS